MKFTSQFGFIIIILSLPACDFSETTKRTAESKDTFKMDTNLLHENITVSLRDSIISFGMEQLGKPYMEAGCSLDGFDCSGFVYFVFQNIKIQVPRISSQFKNFGKEISVDNLRKGDILVFLSPTRNVIGHLGIVTHPNGMSSDFIHASSGNEMKVMLSSLKQEGYKRRFLKAVDVL